MPQDQLPKVGGLIAQYFGPSGSDTRYYWVQAVYPDGKSQLAGPVSVTINEAALSASARVLISWRIAIGVSHYKVFKTTTSAIPTSGAILLDTTTSNGAEDKGQVLATHTVLYDGFYVARARYDFATDGGVQGEIVPVITSVIPAGAILLGAILNSTTAFTSGGSATVAVGTSAGSAANSIKTATAVASLSANALINGTVTFAAPVKMMAEGKISITVATADLTAGVLEIAVMYVLATKV